MKMNLGSGSLTAFAAGLLIASGPAAYADGGTVFAVQGEISGGVSITDSENTGTGHDDGTYPILEGAARVNIPAPDNFAFQFDIDGLATFTDRDHGEDNLQTAYTTGLHAAYRKPGHHAVGLFGALGSSNGGEDENALFGLIGAEGQMTANNTTVIGQAGYFVADDETENDVMTDAWLLRGVARYFMEPDQRIQGELTYASGEASDSACCDIDAWDWGLRYDQRFENTPMGWAIGYRGAHVENDDSPADEFTEHTFFAALTFTFGYKNYLTLQENNDRGATWDLPAVDRFTGYTTEIVDSDGNLLSLIN